MHASPHGWRTRSAALALVAVGLVASLGAALSVASSNRAAQARWLNDRAEVVEAATLDTVNVAIVGLSALAAFFENSETVTPREFEGFVSSLDPSIRLLGVAYMAVVPGDRLGTYVARQRAVHPDFAVTGFDPSGELTPVSPRRSVYYPVELFSTGPFLMSSAAAARDDVAALGIGYDAGSPDAWRPSLEYTVERGSPAVSGFVDVGAGENMIGKAFIVSVPVHDAAGATVGIVAAPMVDLLLTTEVDLSVIDGVDWTVSSGAAPPIGGTGWQREIALPGTMWSLTVAPADGALAGVVGIQPWQVLVIGIVITALVAYLFLLIRQRVRERGLMAEMERVVEERERFLASVSHELRTPLTVVTGLTRELRDRPESFDRDEIVELLGLIAQQSDEVAAIVEDLLVAARADFDRISVDSSEVDLREEARRVAAGSGPAIRVVGGPAMAWADPRRVRQVIRNLVSNARRYGGPDMEIRLGSSDGEAWVEVVDSGPPIPIADRSRMFEPYFSSADRSVVGAMGLGLFISQRLAAMLGGSLAYSHDGECSVFRLTLPAAAASEHAA